MYRKILENNVLPKKIIDWNIAYCLKKLNGKIEDFNCNLSNTKNKISFPVLAPPKSNANGDEIIVLMTSILSRSSFLPKVISSLCNQTMLPKKIMINISEEPYLLDEGFSQENSILQALAKNKLVTINWVSNTGPYRKILPFLERHFSYTLTQDQIFVTIDDDTLYPDFFLESLYSAFKTNDCVIAYRGRYIEIEENKICPYENWGGGKTTKRMANLPTGKDGIIYSTKFFNQGVLDIDVALSFAPTADDLWIKWHCAMNGVPAIILNPDAVISDYKSFPVVDFSKKYRDASLYKMHNSSGSSNNNNKAICELEMYYKERFGFNLFDLIRIDGK